MVPALAVLALAFAAAIILVVPAEVMYRIDAGSWYHDARAADAEPRQANDFRLYRSAFPIPKAPERARILVVGGSTTYGFGVQAADAWPRRLGRKLEASHPGRFEVVDVSYLGGHLESFLSDFHQASRRYVPREKWIDGERPAPDDLASWGWRDLDPDIVIVVPLVNDTAPDFVSMRTYGASGRWRRRVQRALDAPVMRRLAISHYLGVALRQVPARDPGFRADVALRTIAESYRGNLERFVSLWGPDRRILLVGLPLLFSEGDTREAVDLAMKSWGTSDRAELDDELSYFPAIEKIEAQARRSVAAERAGRSLVAAEVGRGLKARPFRQRLAVYLDAIHVTAEGHEMFASEIHDLVLSAGAAAAGPEIHLEKRQ